MPGTVLSSLRMFTHLNTFPSVPIHHYGCISQWRRGEDIPPCPWGGSWRLKTNIVWAQETPERHVSFLKWVSEMMMMMTMKNKSKILATINWALSLHRHMPGVLQEFSHFTPNSNLKIYIIFHSLCFTEEKTLFKKGKPVAQLVRRIKIPTQICPIPVLSLSLHMA